MKDLVRLLMESLFYLSKKFCHFLNVFRIIKKMTKKINKKLTLNYGIGLNLSTKIHKQLGLNKRNSPSFIKKKHKEKIENKFLKNKTGKSLKLQIDKFHNFKKKIKIATYIKDKKIK
jgi:ribosomal protein S13